MHKEKVPATLYALCDKATLDSKNISLEQFLKIVLKYKTSYIQYRDKTSSLEIQKNNILYLKQHTTIPIIINDNLELLEYCDGLHLGQEDIKLMQKKSQIKDKELLFKFLKKKYKNKIFGISTHNELEILEANTLDIDYIGLGAYRNTSTKVVEHILGDNISYLAKISKHPVTAIGGVKLNDTIEHITYNVIGSDLYEN